MTKPTEQQLANRRAWINELRTTTKKQGIGKLRRGNSYCCLGIACSTLSTMEGPKPSGTYYFKGMAGTLCNEWFAQTFGVSTTTAVKLNRTLARMNDAERKTFWEIADFLDQPSTWEHAK